MFVSLVSDVGISMLVIVPTMVVPFSRENIHMDAMCAFVNQKIGSKKLIDNQELAVTYRFAYADYVPLV